MINAEVIVTGSLLNNQAPRRHVPAIGNQLAFVSTYFPFDQLVTEFEKQVENVVRRHTQEVLKVARSWCAENGYEIVALGRSPGAEETEFFRQCLKQEPVFPKWDPKLRNIVNLDSADLVLSCLSSLGLESVGRGCKTAICWPPAAFSSSFNSNVEWFSGLGDYGPFWTSSVSELEIRRVLDFVCNCSRYDWKTLETEYSSKFCHFDLDNVIIRGKLQALISK